jgi:hypothetical protein
MILTLGAARPTLWRYASNVSITSASSDDIAAFDSTLNRLCQKLIGSEEFKASWRRVTLQTHGNKLTLPRNLSTCDGCDPITTESWCAGFPLQMYSRWFEFAAQGPGLTCDSCFACAIRGLIPISDTAQTFADPIADSTFYLRAKSTVASGRGINLVGGLDENGDIIEGNVKLLISNGTTTTTQQYTQMPFIEKAMTGASVEFYSVDTTTAVETLLCVYAPSETVPCYKRYVIQSAADGDTFACMCQLAFVPAIQDSDLIIPSVVDALVTGLQAFQFRDRNDFERYQQYMTDAVQTLDTDLQKDTAAEQPMFQMSRGYGCSGIPQLY